MSSETSTTTGGRRISLPAVGTRLGVESARVTGRFWSTLVGFREGSYILIEMPESEIPVGLNAPFSEQDVLTIRYLADGTVVGFRATMLGRVRTPVALTVLAYPRHIQTHSLRRYPRLSCHLPCRARIGEHEIARALLRDVSEFGCQVRVAVADLPPGMTELPADATMQIEVEIPAPSGRENNRERVEGGVVGFEIQGSYALIRLRSERSLDALMNFLSAFTTRVEFGTEP